jgi:hypothetical protein
MQPMGIRVNGSSELANVGKYDPNLISPPFYKPGANVFPVADGTQRNSIPPNSGGDVEAGTAPWASPNGWISIFNGGGAATTYFRWKNEFLGTVLPISGPQQPEVTVSESFAVSQNHPNFDPQTQVKVECDNFDVSALFPARMAVTTSSQKEVSKPKSHLDQSIPNPASTSEVVIPYGIFETFKIAEIEVFELSTGRNIARVNLKESAGKAIISTQGMSAGIYGYRLMLDRKPVETRKMIIIK